MKKFSKKERTKEILYQLGTCVVLALIFGFYMLFAVLLIILDKKLKKMQQKYEM